MKIKKYFTKFGQSYTINLREFNLGEITISRHVGLDMAWSDVRINWAGSGDKSMEDVLKFSDALTIAYQLANCLRNEVDPSVINITIDSWVY